MSSSFPLPLSENEEKEYVELMEAGDPNAKDVLIERNLRLVAHIARKYTGPNTSQEDLISIGTIGLIKAIKMCIRDRPIHFSFNISIAIVIPPPKLDYVLSF